MPLRVGVGRSGFRQPDHRRHSGIRRPGRPTDVPHRGVGRLFGPVASNDDGAGPGRWPDGPIPPSPPLIHQSSLMYLAEVDTGPEDPSPIDFLQLVADPLRWQLVRSSVAAIAGSASS